MSTTITPTVGRVVWFYPAANTQHADFSPPAAGEPLAAIIAGVLPGHPVDIVNLTVFDAMGFAHARTMVPLLQDGDERPEGGFFATWMPYQIGQAKKHADEPKTAAMTQCSGQITGAQDDSYVRFQTLDMALRTPGIEGYDNALRAAREYQQHIEGRPADPPLASQQPAPGAAHAGYSTMQPHQQRVVDERAELDGRLAKLNTFIDGATFSTLDADSQNLLKQQAATMAMYSDILTDRIAAF